MHCFQAFTSSESGALGWSFGDHCQVVRARVWIGKFPYDEGSSLDVRPKLWQHPVQIAGRSKLEEHDQQISRSMTPGLGFRV